MYSVLSGRGSGPLSDREDRGTRGPAESQGKVNTLSWHDRVADTSLHVVKSAIVCVFRHVRRFLSDKT